MDAECPACGGPMPAPAKDGRPRLYCSDRCRKSAYRGRQLKAYDWTAGGLRPASLVMVEPAPARKAPARKVDTELELLSETRGLERRWRLQGELGSDGLALRCTRLADGLRALLDELFGQVR